MPALLSPRKLRDAVDASEKRLRPLRQARTQAIRHYAKGADAKQKTIINLVHRTARTQAAHLAAGNPKHDARTPRREYRPAALLQQLALDHLGEELNRQRISRELLKDGLFGPCMVARVGVRAGNELLTIDGRQYDPGLPYVRRVSLDNLIYDPGAKHDDEALFIGERYPVFLEQALANPNFKGKEDRIRRLRKLSDGRLGDQKGQRADDLFHEGLSDRERFGLLEMVELMDIAVYDSGATYIVTIAADPNDAGDPLHVYQWQGPERGPFVKDQFDDIPDQPFGVPPVEQAIAASTASNEVINRLLKQMARLKSIMAYQPTSRDEALQIARAEDGDTVKVNDVTAIKMLQMDGVTPGLQPFAGLLLQLWNEQTGNIQTLSGSAPQGVGSATEFAGVAAGAGVLIDDLRRVHERFETEISNRLAFFMRNDPLRRPLPLVHRLPGGELLEVQYTPEQREDEFGQITFKIKARSMTSDRTDPNLRQRRIVELVAGIAQVAQVAAVTGGVIDFAGTVRVMAREFGIEELDEVIGDPAYTALIQQLYGSVQPPSRGASIGRVPGMRATSTRKFSMGDQGRTSAMGGIGADLGAQFGSLGRVA